MSLSFDDFQTIRMIMREELNERITPLEGKVEALDNDVKEIYGILARVERAIVRLDRGIVSVARQTGSKLPRSFTKSYGQKA